MRLLTVQAVECFEHASPGVEPGTAATLALRTPPAWFDDVDPATQFALVWYESASPDPELSRILADSVRVGYRIGRIYLDDVEPAAPPALGMSSFSDVFAEALFRATLDVDHAAFFDALPDDVTIANVVASQALAARWRHLLPDSTQHGLASACLFGVDTGTALALAERQLADL
jgi:hypothetical protein